MQGWGRRYRPALESLWGLQSLAGLMREFAKTFIFKGRSTGFCWLLGWVIILFVKNRGPWLHSFYASATKHLGIGLWSVGWLVGRSVGNKFQKSFKNDLCACQLSTYSSRCLELGWAMPHSDFLAWLSSATLKIFILGISSQILML